MRIQATINFDLDGTLADLYAVENWLPKLRAEDASPYTEAAPLVRLSSLARSLNRLQREGYELAIISWLSKNGSDEYGEKVTAAKLKWLSKHLPSVHWNRITIVPYGTPKENFCNCPLDILFDDEKKNRDNWTGRAYGVNDILETLKKL